MFRAFLSLFLLFASGLHSQLDPTPYLLPSDHRLKPVLDKLFADPATAYSAKAFMQAGFQMLVPKRPSGIRVAKHPALKGYLVKIYLKSEVKSNYQKSQQSLIQRCVGASEIQKLITRKLQATRYSRGCYRDVS